MNFTVNTVLSLNWLHFKCSHRWPVVPALNVDLEHSFHNCMNNSLLVTVQLVTALGTRKTFTDKFMCGFACKWLTQTVKNLPVMQEMWVWSLGQENTLKKEMATHSSILAQRIPWTEEPGRLQSMGSQRIEHNQATNTLHVCDKPRLGFPIPTYSLWPWASNCPLSISFFTCEIILMVPPKLSVSEREVGVSVG